AGAPRRARGPPAAKPPALPRLRPPRLELAPRAGPDLGRRRPLVPVVGRAPGCPVAGAGLLAGEGDRPDRRAARGVRRRAPPLRRRGDRGGLAMTAVAAPPGPYKGLSAFDDTEVDALLFFGRGRERDVLVANLLASRLTVLYGESGVGKSSILRAGVARELRRVAPEADVVVHDTWAGDPAGPLGGLDDDVETYLILDQFEEYFVYNQPPDAPGTLVAELPELLRRSPRTNVL